MTAPERIWAMPSEDGWMAPYVGNAPCEGAVEYVRADLATPAAPRDGGPAYPVMWEYAEGEAGMSDAPERYNDTWRNAALNKAVGSLDRIINRHDPEVDCPVNQGVWDFLDRLVLAFEDRQPPANHMDDPRVVALVEAAKLMVAGYEGDDDRTISGYHALVAALAAMKCGAA